MYIQYIYTQTYLFTYIIIYTHRRICLLTCLHNDVHEHSNMCTYMQVIYFSVYICSINMNILGVMQLLDSETGRAKTAVWGAERCVASESTYVYIDMYIHVNLYCICI